MAMAMAALLLLVLVAAPAAVHSAQHSVAWNQGTDYSNYGAGQTFTVGDTLVFTYSTSHGVDVVGQSDYSNCNSGNALNSYSGGQTTITLTTPGTMYFMCPTFGHCQGGMKLSIPVVAAGGSTTSPATPTSPSSSGSSSPTVTTPPDSSSSGSSSTTGSTPVITTTTSSPKSYSGAGGMFVNMNNLVVIGFSVVVAGLVGFMG
ncbi:uclacyanin-2-like [Rhododendron vialii]|uniref:uclacyanin-2-like n=1 Tax=Rhododendron vialii TaxID=182163 RepID=UPI00265E50CC|nr:uclacyanin-2-like [Rhododendron vialii]